jgi:hypothetical protein
MSVPRHVCHRCRTKWTVKRKNPARECPKCGCDNIGPTDPAMGLLPKLAALVVLVIAGAYAAGFLTDADLQRAQQHVEGAVDDVRREVEAQTGNEPAESPGPGAPSPEGR